MSCLVGFTVVPFLGGDEVGDDGPAGHEVEEDGDDQGGDEVGGGGLLGQLVRSGVGSLGQSDFNLTENNNAISVSDLTGFGYIKWRSLHTTIRFHLVLDVNLKQEFRLTVQIYT